MTLICGEPASEERMGEAAALLLCGECGVAWPSEEGGRPGRPPCGPGGGGSGETGTPPPPPPGGIRCGESSSLAGDTLPDLKGFELFLHRSKISKFEFHSGD